MIRRMLLLILLFLSGCVPSPDRDFISPQTIHRPVIVVYDHRADLKAAKKRLEMAFSVIKSQLNISYDIEVETIKEFNMTLRWFDPLLACSFYARQFENKNYTIYCLVNDGIPHDDQLVLGVTSLTEPISISQVDGNEFLAINTIIHEMGHQLGAHHESSGMMYFKAEDWQEYEVGRYSLESVRAIKKQYIKAADRAIEH